MTESRTELERALEQATRGGLLIEAGWLALRLDMPSATAEELDVAKMSFFAGANHLWVLIMDAMEPSEHLERMDRILRELKQFSDQMQP